MPRTRARKRQTRQQRFRLHQEHKNDLTNVLNISNKIIETLMTLLAIYLLTELHAVPQGCRFLDCVNEYAKHELGDDEPDFFVRPCSLQREFCYFSYGNDRSFAAARDSGRYINEEALNGTFGAMRDYCRCLLNRHEQDLFCQFGVARSSFFIVAVLIVALMEATVNVKGLRHHLLRLMGFTMTFVVYLCIYLYFNSAQSTCDSFDLSLSLRVINSLVYSSYFVLCVTVVFELWFWRNAFKKTRELKEQERAEEQERSSQSYT